MMSKSDTVNIIKIVTELFSKYTEDAERRIKFLEDNAFLDRARIGELENKVQVLEKASK